MLQIGDTLVSVDVFDRRFVCDISTCRGICCVEGDSGAPLEKQETDELYKILPAVWNDLSSAAKEIIRTKGVSFIDAEGDTVTTTVGKKDCVFTCYDNQGICRCSVEKAWNEGRIDFRKPISCQLYPIYVKEYENYKAVNYHHWHKCRTSELLGEKLQTPLYIFLKDALIRKFGQEWYDELTLCAKEWDRRPR
jgi:hypothetical protein